MKRWKIILLSLVIGSWAIAQQQMMTREQAAQIALRFIQTSKYPGTLHWLTVADLPAGQEVHMEDYASKEQLFDEGKDWAVTMDDKPATWFGSGDLFTTTYAFLVTFDRWPDRRAIVYVNAYTGYTVVERYREFDETNDDLGYGNLPVKTYEELRSIALNIAEQMLGPGTFKVFPEEPYDLSNPEHYEHVSKGGCLFLIFKQDSSTGALLPQTVYFVLNTRTGEMEAGEYENRPVEVSTIPKITRKQAQQNIATYLAGLGYEVVEWLSDGYYAGMIIHGTGLGRDALVGLCVINGPCLEQYLMWHLIFAYKKQGAEETLMGYAMVNAHTGEVYFGFSTAMHMGLIRPNRKWLREGIPVLYINHKLIYPLSRMHLVNGKVYVPAKWTQGLGVKWDGTNLIGHYGVKTIKDRLLHKGQLYLPLRAICEVSGIRLWWDNERKVPVLRAEWLEAKKLLAQRQR